MELMLSGGSSSKAYTRREARLTDFHVMHCIHSRTVRSSPFRDYHSSTSLFMTTPCCNSGCSSAPRVQGQVCASAVGNAPTGLSELLVGAQLGEHASVKQSVQKYYGEVRACCCSTSRAVFVWRVAMHGWVQRGPL